MKDLSLEPDIPAPKPESTKHLRTLANGAVYDMRTHRIVDSRNVTNKITSENAADMAQYRTAAKRAALARAANAVAMQGGGVDGRELAGDLAFVEAIGEAMTMKALTVNDPKAVDAARFVFAETGIAERNGKADDEPTAQGNNVYILIAQYISQLSSAGDVQIHETIDGEVKGE